MSGLNDEALAELNQPNQDVDGITEGGDSKTSPEENVIVLDTETGPTEEDVEILPMLQEQDVWIQTTEENQTELDRLQDVAKSILVAETISRTDVANALALMNDESFTAKFTDEVSSLAAFTLRQTQVNLEETKEFFAGEIQQRQAALEEQRTQVSKDDFIVYRKAAEQYIAFSTEVIEQLDALVPIAQAAMQKATASKNGIVLIATKESDALVPTINDIRYTPFGYPTDKMVDLLELSEPFLRGVADTIRDNKAQLKRLRKHFQISEASIRNLACSHDDDEDDEDHKRDVDYMKFLSMFASGRYSHNLSVANRSIELSLEKLTSDSDSVSAFELTSGLFTFGKVCVLLNKLARDLQHTITAFDRVL